MLIIYTGNGKGKTTAALGSACRALGRGKRMLMIQFIKSPEWKSGEDYFFEKSKIVKMGLGFVGILGDKHPRSAHEEVARKTWELCKEAVDSKKYNFSAPTGGRKSTGFCSESDRGREIRYDRA